MVELFTLNVHYKAWEVFCYHQSDTGRDFYRRVKQEHGIVDWWFYDHLSEEQGGIGRIIFLNKDYAFKWKLMDNSIVVLFSKWQTFFANQVQNLKINIMNEDSYNTLLKCLNDKYGIVHWQFNMHDSQIDGGRPGRVFFESEKQALLWVVKYG